MATKTAERRDRLRSDLTVIAERLIEEGGLTSLKARDVAAEAGCSLGAIYNVFEDMDELVFAVNGRTLARLDEALSSRTGSIENDDIIAIMTTLAMVYLEFAAENPRLWSALFEHEYTDGRPTPEWLVTEQVKLIGHIALPLRRYLPSMSDAEIQTLARALFSAVHGIVLLGTENRFVAVPLGEIRTQLDVIVKSTMHGLRRS